MAGTEFVEVSQNDYQVHHGILSMLETTGVKVGEQFTLFIKTVQGMNSAQRALVNNYQDEFVSIDSVTEKVIRIDPGVEEGRTTPPALGDYEIEITGAFHDLPDQAQVMHGGVAIIPAIAALSKLIAWLSTGVAIAYTMYKVETKDITLGEIGDKVSDIGGDVGVGLTKAVFPIILILLLVMGARYGK